MAIPLEELRLGNWVLINHRYIHMDTRIFHAVLQGFDGYVPEPIVITEDILRACGFDYFEDNKSFQLDSAFGFSIWGRERIVHVYKNSDEIGVDITTLHHLQNVYRDLTKTDLNIQL